MVLDDIGMLRMPLSVPILGTGTPKRLGRASHPGSSTNQSLAIDARVSDTVSTGMLGIASIHLP